MSRLTGVIAPRQAELYIVIKFNWSDYPVEAELHIVSSLTGLTML